jgi:hypothetical protein
MFQAPTLLASAALPVRRPQQVKKEKLKKVTGRSVGPLERPLLEPLDV